MDNPPLQPPATARAPDALLALNLTTARAALEWTQEALSASSRISRATIAQIEAGDSDPRLSTLWALARALGIPASLLLLGPAEAHALATLGRQGGAIASRPAPALTTSRDWLDAQTTRDRSDIIRLTTRQLGAGDRLTIARVLACIFATYLPDRGVNLGAALGQLLASAEQPGGKINPGETAR